MRVACFVLLVSASAFAQKVLIAHNMEFHFMSEQLSFLEQELGAEMDFVFGRIGTHTNVEFDCVVHIASFGFCSYRSIWSYRGSFTTDVQMVEPRVMNMAIGSGYVVHQPASYDCELNGKQNSVRDVVTSDNQEKIVRVLREQCSSSAQEKR